MAKAAKKTSKARARSARQGSPPKTAARQKRLSSRKSGEQSTSSESWLSAAGTLVTSAAGREILAEVLEATASILRRDRASIGEEQRPESPSTTANVLAQGATGVLTRTAAGVLAEVAASAARSMLPGRTERDDDDDDDDGDRGGRAGRR